MFDNPYLTEIVLETAVVLNQKNPFLRFTRKWFGRYPTAAQRESTHNFGIIYYSFLYILKVFVGPTSILWGNWYPLFGTSDEFQSDGE